MARKLKRSIEIMCSYGMTMSKGNYENDKNRYSINEVIEFEGDFPLEEIQKKQKMYRDLCKAMCDEDIKILRPESINVTDDKKEVVTTDWYLQKKMTYLSLISQTANKEDLIELGKSLLKEKEKFPKEFIDEIRTEYEKKLGLLNGNS